tara:strand:+ start:12375 stop:13148 length:774 start_codon:yes stop_codon:yes gene_type:complete
MTAKIKLNAASGGGSVSIQAPSSSSNTRVITLPDIADGTLVTSQSTLDATKLSGALPAISGANLTGISSDFVKLQEATGSNLGSQLIFDNLDTATYRSFRLYFALLPNGTADGYYPYFRFRTGGASGADETAAHYSWAYEYGYQNDGHSHIARINNTYASISHTVGGQATVEGMQGIFDVILCRSGDSFNTGTGGSYANWFLIQHNEVENLRAGNGILVYNNSSTVNHTGFTIYMGSGGSAVGGFANYKYALYGVKG